MLRKIAIGVFLVLSTACGKKGDPFLKDTDYPYPGKYPKIEEYCRDEVCE